MVKIDLKKCYTKNTMQNSDKYSIEKGMESLVLMERAALGIFNVLKKFLNNNSSILILAGSGNNGGDAIALARILHSFGYKNVELVITFKEAKSRECMVQLELCRELKIPIWQIKDGDITKYDNIDSYMQISAYKDRLRISEYLIYKAPDIIVDGLFGIGFNINREIDDSLVNLINECNSYIIQKQTENNSNIQANNLIDLPFSYFIGKSKSSLYLPCILSIDIPSGMDSNTGNYKTCVSADLVISMGYAKLGTLLTSASEKIKNLIVCDIGLLDSYDDNIYCNIHREYINLVNKENANKGTRGSLTIVGGDRSMTGALQFAVKSAYAIGVGKVHIISSEDNRAIMQMACPEGIFHGAKINNNRLCNTEELSEIIKNSDAILIGNGFSKEKYCYELMELVLDRASKPIVIDGTGINLFTDIRKNKSVKYKFGLCFTPHIKEFSYMTDLSIEYIKNNSITAIDKFFNENNLDSAILCVKDFITIIASKDFKYINNRGCEALAKAGTGDVLAGMIAGAYAIREGNGDKICTSNYVDDESFLITAVINHNFSIMSELWKEKYGNHGLIIEKFIEMLAMEVGYNGIDR